MFILCVSPWHKNLYCLPPLLSDIDHHRIRGTVSRDFLLQVFFMNQFPPAPKYPIRTISNFVENSLRYSQVKVHHWYQQHRRQIFPPVSLVLLIPVSNLPPVSMTLVASCHLYQQHRCQRYRWQICLRCQ